MSAFAGPDERGLYHYGPLCDRAVDADARWHLASVVVSACSELEVPLPAVGCFVAESEAERADVDAHGGDRTCFGGDIAAPIPVRAVMVDGRLLVDREHLYDDDLIELVAAMLACSPTT